MSSTTYGYDNVGNLTSEVDSNGSGDTLVSYANTYDNQNRITNEARTDSSGTVNTPYSYDAASQVTGQGSQSLSYDAAGDPTNSGDVLVTDNQISSDSTWNYSYDADGTVVRMFQEPTGNYWTFAYNLNNQVTAAKEYNYSGSLIQEVDYVYDVFGNMLSRTVSSSGSSLTTEYSYNVSGTQPGVNTTTSPLWAELDGIGNITERYLTDASGTLMARSGTQTDGVAWLLTDNQGSVRDVLNASGALEASVSYGAFGNITSETSGTSGWLGDYGWQGLYNDAVLSVNMAKYRFVLPDGQWSGKDPLSFAAGDANLQRVVGNDTANETDPSGLADELSPFSRDFKDGDRTYKVKFKVVFSGEDKTFTARVNLIAKYIAILDYALDLAITDVKNLIDHPEQEDSKKTLEHLKNWFGPDVSVADQKTILEILQKTFAKIEHSTKAMESSDTTALKIVMPDKNQMGERVLAFYVFPKDGNEKRLWDKLLVNPSLFKVRLPPVALRDDVQVMEFQATTVAHEFFHYAAGLPHTARDPFGKEAGPYVDFKNYLRTQTPEKVPTYKTFGDGSIRGAYPDQFKGVKLKEADAYTYFLFQYYYERALNAYKAGKND